MITPRVETEYPTFVCDYYHEDRRWSIHIQARDEADAEARARTLGQLEVLGELVETIPL